jgi:hypothetical protein
VEGDCSFQLSYANLLRCAAPVAPHLVRYGIQHTSCFSPCGILSLTSRFRASHPSSLVMDFAFCREASDSILHVSIRISLIGLCSGPVPRSLVRRRRPGTILIGHTHQLRSYRLPTDGERFGVVTGCFLTRACLDGPSLALVCRLSSFGTVTCLTLTTLSRRL